MTNPKPDPPTPAFGLTIYHGLPDLDLRQIDLLRGLGRLELADSAIIRQTFYRNHSETTLKRDLQHLYEHRLIWRTQAPPTPHALAVNPQSQTGRVGGRRRHVYGLSHEGKVVLDSLGVEPDQRSLDHLRTRESRGRYTAPSTLGHDLQVAWWCASMLEGLRQIPWCHSVYLQTEFVVSDRQRMDAILVARFDLTGPRPDREQVPWFDGTPLRPDQVELRWALELDTGTEAIPVLLRKFVWYRDHHRDGVYAHVLGGPVLLVLLVQHERRAGLLATEFQRAWPEGWGVVSLPKAGVADHPQYGALWGTYRRLIDSQISPLLTPILPTGSGTPPRPLLSLRQWESYLHTAAEGTPPPVPPPEPDSAQTELQATASAASARPDGTAG